MALLRLLLLLVLVMPARAQTPPSRVTFKQGDIGSILGRAVLDASASEIGRVVDVLVDGDGKPMVALLDVGGFMGLGVRRVAVGWETLRFSHQGAETTITETLSYDDIAAGPEYRGDDGPIEVLTGPKAAP